MGTVIDFFEGRKVVDYLRDGVASACIEFDRDFLDVVLFYPLFVKLRYLFEGIGKFDLAIRSEFLSVFNEDTVSCYELNAVSYDYVFHLRYAADPLGKLSRNEVCCHDELGLEYGELPALGFEDMTSPFVAVDFNADINSDTMSCSRENAAKVCAMILQRGYVPLDVHYFRSADGHVPSYSFIDNSATRFIAGHPERLVSVMERCYAYVGVFGESFTVARKLFGDNCVLLRNDNTKLNVYLDKDASGREVDLRNSGGWADLAVFLDGISNNQFGFPGSEDGNGLSIETRRGTRANPKGEFKPRTFRLKKKNESRVVYI